MDWGSEDMTETDDSEYEDPVDRDNRLYVENCNYDLSEGMTPMQYTPPLRRRYEVQKKNKRDITESISGTSEEGSRTVEDPTSPEEPVESNTAATLRNDKDMYSQSELTGLTGCGAYSSTSERWEIVDRPVTKGDMARSGIKTDFPCQEHSDIVDRPVTESLSAREGNDTKFPSYEHSDKQSVLVDRPGTESVMSRSGSKTKFLSDVHSGMVDRPVKESVTAGDGSSIDSPKGEHLYIDNAPDTESKRTQYRSATDCRCSKDSEFSDRPVTRSGSARAERNTDYRSDEHSGVLDRPVTESVTERPTDTLETLGVHGPTVVAEKPDLRVVEFITDCRQPRMTSLFPFKQIVTGSYVLTDNRLCFGVCGGSRWFSLFVIMDQFMRTGTQSRSKKHLTVSYCCVAIYVFRQDQLFPPVVALSAGGVCSC